MSSNRLIAWALLATPFALLGCAKNPNAPAKISGKISYKGQPIKAGNMAFHTQDGTAFAAQISDDGTYSATDIAEGELIVTVSTEHLRGAAEAIKHKDYEKRMKMPQQQPPSDRPAAVNPSTFYIKIPDKYASAKSSPVTVTVKSGRNVKDIDLE